MAPKAKARSKSAPKARGKSVPKARAKSSPRSKAKAKAKAEPGPANEPEAAQPTEVNIPPAPPEPEHVPVEGKCKVRYNHYNKDFPVVDGKLKWADIDDEYCISFVFKGNYTVSVECPDGTRLGPLTPADESLPAIFSGCVHDAQHTLIVEEDPALADEPRTVYVAASSDNFIKRGGGDAGVGEDNASCSCLFGNPCQSAYSCQDWQNRYEVAKKNGWKGF